MFKPTKEQSREYGKRYALKHPEKVAANVLRQKERKIALYKSDPEFREKMKARSRESYAKNRDAIRAKRRGCEKEKAYRKAYHRTEKTRRRTKNHLFRQKYGITIEQYDEMLASQNGVCSICGGTTAVDKWQSGLRNLQVDHCHDTGRVRGLLCFHCNTGIGHFRDNTELLLKAIKYLEHSRADLPAHASCSSL